MSRSFHTTYAGRARLEKTKFASPDHQRVALARADRALAAKRRAKRNVANERKLAGTDRSNDLAAVALTVRDESPFVVHGASPEDIRAILQRVPPEAVHGLRRIELSLGRLRMERSRPVTEPQRDPHTQRVSSLLLPGVWGPPVLGVLRPSSNTIAIYAWVVDPAATVMPAEALRAYLRLHSLKTLVHELAHHRDLQVRTARGRWRSDRERTYEHHAEEMEHAWTLETILPYLLEVDAAGARQLEEWFAAETGERMPLSFFAGDPRATRRTGPNVVVLDSSLRFEKWARRAAALAPGKPRADAWLAVNAEEDAIKQDREGPKVAAI